MSLETKGWKQQCMAPLAITSDDPLGILSFLSLNSGFCLVEGPGLPKGPILGRGHSKCPTEL